MTLHIYDELEQGTEEWFDVRRGIVTASVVGRLVTAKTLKPADNDESRGLTALLAAERITGWTYPTFMNDDMWRGHDLEPVARDFYSAHFQQAEQCGFLLRQEDGWSLGYSPDALVGTDGLVEVKCPRPKAHLATILADEVPAYYMAQLMGGLLVSGRSWVDFVSCTERMSPWVKRVYPDERWFDAIEQACRTFETNAAAMVATYRERTGLPVIPARETGVELKLA